METIPIDHLEVIADAIMHHEGWSAGSRSNRNRNPGNLRQSPDKIGEDAGGYAIFSSLCEGYDALLFDLRSKFTGHTSTGLTPDSTFAELIAKYAPAEDQNDPASYFAAVKEWFQTATGKALTPETTLRQIWTPAYSQGMTS